MADSPLPRRPRTVSLVLGSGGARGLAHIGVIQALNEIGYEIRSIAGASMGALVGGIFAAGRLDVYTRWVTALQKADVVRLLDLSFGSAGLFKGERIIDTLRDLIGEVDIESLPMTFTAVATDLDRQREFWFTRGPLFDAIRASIAVPTVFTPFDYRGRRLLDGGLLNPVPIAPTFRDDTDVTIAVNLNARSTSPTPLMPTTPVPETVGDTRSYRYRIREFIENMQGELGRRPASGWDFSDVVNRSFETMQNAIAHNKLTAYPPDILIEIPRSLCASYEFYRARELIDAGHRIALARLA